MNGLDRGVIYRSMNKRIQRRIGRIFRYEQHGGARSAERNPKNGRVFRQGEEQREKRAGFQAVGLMEAILHGGTEEVSAALGEGGHEESGSLNVGDCVVAGVGRRQEGARLSGGEPRGGQD
jgi:hypothetical protein